MDRLVVPTLRARLLLPLSLLLAIILVGTLGYVWLWREAGGTWMDALFMTVTTITTIGYGEVRPLDTAGRLFTIVLALAGVAGFFYTMGVVMEYLVSVRLADPGGRRRMERRIAELSGHVIVAGLGRVGPRSSTRPGLRSWSWTPARRPRFTPRSAGTSSSRATRPRTRSWPERGSSGPAD